MVVSVSMVHSELDSLDSVPFVFKYSWFNPIKKQVYKTEIGINYDSESGRIVEFLDDLEIANYGNSILYNNIRNFFRNHFGLEGRYILKPVNPEGNRNILIKKESLNSRLNDYYQSPKPREKCLIIKNGKLEISWTGFWQGILS